MDFVPSRGISSRRNKLSPNGATPNNHDTPAGESLKKFPKNVGIARASPSSGVKRRLLRGFTPPSKPPIIAMTEATKRSITRWIHLIFSIPIVGYIYSPFPALPNYALTVRYVAVPLIVLTGFWMWLGTRLIRATEKASA